MLPWLKGGGSGMKEVLAEMYFYINVFFCYPYFKYIYIFNILLYSTFLHSQILKTSQNYTERHSGANVVLTIERDFRFIFQ